MVTQLTDHSRQFALKNERHEEFHLSVDKIDIILRCFVILFLIYVYRNEHYTKEKIKKWKEEKEKLKENEKEMEELERRIDALWRRRGIPPGRIGILVEKIGTLLGKIDDLQGRVDEPQETVGVLPGGIDEHQRSTGVLRRIEDPQGKIGAHLGKIDELQGILEDPQETIDKLQERIEDDGETIDKYKQEKDRIKAQFKSDQKKKNFQHVNVTLDAATAHPALLLSEKGKQVTCQEKYQDPPSSAQRFDSLSCVLGQLGMRSGRNFWEINVENTGSWDLGICRDNVTRKGRVTISPDNGFWAIRLYEGEYWALTSPETLLSLKEKPHVVGIFLDYEDGEISFYNMTDGSHIFTFSKNTFNDVLRPLFRLWSCDSGTLTIV